MIVIFRYIIWNIIFKDITVYVGLCGYDDYSTQLTKHNHYYKIIIKYFLNVALIWSAHIEIIKVITEQIFTNLYIRSQLVHNCTY